MKTLPMLKNGTVTSPVSKMISVTVTTAVREKSKTAPTNTAAQRAGSVTELLTAASKKDGTATSLAMKLNGNALSDLPLTPGERTACAA